MKPGVEDIKDEKGLIEFGEQFFQDSAKGKKKEEQQWLLNIAMIAGDQLAKVNRQTGSLDRVPIERDPDWQIRIVDNRILPIYRTIMSKLTKNKPMPSAKAMSREDSDIQAARAAIKLEECHWNTLKMAKKHTELAGWLTSTGNGFYKQFWNPKRGENITDTENIDTEAGMNADGTPIMRQGDPEQVNFNLGDTDLVFRSPFNVYPQRGKTSMDTMTMIGDCEQMTADEIEETYGKRVEPGGDSSKSIKVNLASATGDGVVSDEENKNVITVKEMYILPCKKFKNGLYFVWANGVLLSSTEECKKLPYVHFRLIEIPGKFWGRSIIDDVIPLQRRWNHLLSKVEMHNDYYNDPPFLYDPGVIDIEDWTSEPGLGLPVDGLANYQGKPVQVVDVPALDPTIFQELQLLDAQFEIVPILNKVSYGKDSPNARSGISINFLQEKDDDIIRPFIENMENGYADVFKFDFQLCQEYYEEDRGFSIVGEDNESEWLEFKRANLDANVDVGVEPGSAMPRSKVAQQAMVMDMLKAGFFTDPNTGMPDYRKALKYLEFGSVDDIYQDAALDANQARRENEHMKQGAIPEAKYWHNHEAHIFEHLRMMKTADFDKMDPQLQMLAEMHLQMHEQFMQPPVDPNADPNAAPGADPNAAAPAAEAAEPAPAQESPAGDMNTVEAYLQSIKRQDPKLFAQLSALPHDEMVKQVTEAMNHTGD